MIQLENISYSIGTRTLFSDVNLQINSGDKIALVGKNGTGKTTFFRLLNQMIKPESGKFTIAKYAKIGYLEQETPVLSGMSVLDEVTKCFKDIEQTKEEIKNIEYELEDFKEESEHHSNLIERLGELHSMLDHLDAYSIEARAKSVLTGLGFKQNDFHRMTDEFSGGWQMRIALAKILLQRPWLIMLDEPTNHLDLDSLLWLEEFLKKHDGALLIISHDKSFLDSITKNTWEISNSKINVYKCNYSKYLIEKEFRKEQMIALKENQEAKIKHLEDFVNRFKAKASKATQAQSKLKQLEKIEVIELEQESDSIAVRFPAPPKSGKVVVKAEKISKSYSSLNVLKDVSFTIERGDKIGIVGANGEGKSTLARILCNQEGYEIGFGGCFEYGLNVTPAYFGQHQAKELNLTKTVLSTILDEVPTSTSETFIRSLLGALLFKGDDVFKSVRVLSGGEKGRLALAKVLVSNANLLILDEPTNHLDIDSKNVLLNALQNYAGTLIIISHDRDFIDPLANKIFEVKDKSVNLHLGNCSDYIARIKQFATQTSNSSQTAGTNKNSTISNPLDTTLSLKEQKRIEAENRQQKSKELKPIKEKLTKLESEISKFENKKSEIESQMSDENFYKNSNKVKETLKELNSVKESLDGLYLDWENINLQIEEIETKYQ